MTSDTFTPTDTLENELRELSQQLEIGKTRFNDVREELRRRHEAGNDQPKPVELTNDQRREDEELNAARALNVMTNKIIAMEVEQAKLVVEAEVAKAAQREAETRLALLAKLIAASDLNGAVATMKDVLQVMTPVSNAMLNSAAGMYERPEPTTTPGPADKR
jgi:hypothetical protein